MTRCLFGLLALAACVSAQFPTHGTGPKLTATAVVKDGPRLSAPSSAASAMYLPPAMERFDGLKLPGSTGDHVRALPLAQVRNPKFQFKDEKLVIKNEVDVCFLGIQRIVRIRVRLEANGMELVAFWKKNLQDYFNYLDRDGNGFLNAFETEFMVSPGGMKQVLLGNLAYPQSNEPGKTFKDLDVDRDGQISRDEFFEYYLSSASEMIVPSASGERDVYAESLTDALFDWIDTNKDRKLSKEELQTAAREIGRFDRDEDENVSARELYPDLFNGRVKPRDNFNSEARIRILSVSETPAEIAEYVLKLYDRNQNLRLEAAESPFEESQFKQLDRNRDGTISITELLRIHELVPDLRIAMNLSSRSDKPSSIRIVPDPSGKPYPMAKAVQDAGNATFNIVLDGQVIRLTCYIPRGVYNQSPMNSILIFPSNKQELTERDVAGPEFQSLRVLFDSIDRNGNGRVTREEYDTFVKLNRQLSDMPLRMLYSAPTPGLFQLIDRNGDGRLSPGEIHSAWERLMPLEPEVEGKKPPGISRASLKPQGSFRYMSASDTVNFNPTAPYSAQSTVTPTGPIWFQKLDRNGDGEISRGEFPGTREMFDQLDLNRDGLITLDEAEKADAIHRKKRQD